tara:strand:+ start:951 stop:1400 length:450 start_codon:yes stop_codon:yes gene_type:complete
MKNLILIIALAISTAAFSQESLDTFFKVSEVSYSNWDERNEVWGEYEEGNVKDLNSNFIIMHENSEWFLIPSLTQGNILIRLTELVEDSDLGLAFNATYTNTETTVDITVIIKDTSSDQAVMFVIGSNLIIAYKIEYHSQQPHKIGRTY